MRTCENEELKMLGFKFYTCSDAFNKRACANALLGKMLAALNISRHHLNLTGFLRKYRMEFALAAVPAHIVLQLRGSLGIIMTDVERSTTSGKSL